MMEAVAVAYNESECFAADAAWFIAKALEDLAVLWGVSDRMDLYQVEIKPAATTAGAPS